MPAIDCGGGVCLSLLLQVRCHWAPEVGCSLGQRAGVQHGDRPAHL